MITSDALAKLMLELAELRKINREQADRIRELEAQVYGGSTK